LGIGMSPLIQGDEDENSYSQWNIPLR